MRKVRVCYGSLERRPVLRPIMGRARSHSYDSFDSVYFAFRICARTRARKRARFRIR